MHAHPWSAATNASLERFAAARFGLFIHWGLYAVAAGSWEGRQVDYIGEWIQHGERIPGRRYRDLGHGFTADRFIARDWVATAMDAGARYLVLTAKHHEGFALWHSRCDPFNAVEGAACRRDLLAELAEACRDAGLPLGLYYSHCVDWSEAHGGNLPCDRKDDRTWGNDWDFPRGDAVGFDAYLRRKVEPQLTELLTGYGDIALIWFDTPTAGLRPDQAQRLRDLVKRLQPGCLIGGRIGHGLQDFDGLGDNQVPRTALARPGEACMTLNDTWGYKAHDHAWADPAEVVGLLAACTARNCNLLLNVGPRADGTLPEAATARLAAVGAWLRRHGAAIHGAGAAGLPSDPPWGQVTLNGNALHAIVTDGTLDAIALPTMDGGWLTVQPGRSEDGMPLHAAVPCADPPRFPSIPAEDPSGALDLPAASGRHGGQPWSGCLHGGQQAAYRVRLAAPGRFRISLVCGGERYGQWYGGHEIELRGGGTAKRIVLDGGAMERGRRWQHYPARSAVLGDFDLPGGEQELTLAMLATASSSPAHLPLLRLRRLAQSSSR